MTSTWAGCTLSSSRIKAATAATVADCLSSGSDVSATGTRETTPLHNAARLSVDPEVLNVLLNAGADVNARADFKKSQSLIAKLDRFLEGLFPSLVDEESRKDFGDTPLHYAAGLNKNPEVLTVLLNAGAEVSHRYDDHRLFAGYTPLLFAARNNNPEVLTALLEAGADVNARGEDGDTPLHEAAQGNENSEAITVLLAAQAELNARNDSGDTPLHMAAGHNENPEVLNVLLDAGADGTAVNGDDETPLDLAKDNEALAGTDAYWALNDARFE